MYNKSEVRLCANCSNTLTNTIMRVLWCLLILLNICSDFQPEIFVITQIDFAAKSVKQNLSW